MNKLNQNILYTIKKLINDDNLDYLQEYYNDIVISDQQINFDFIFQKAYIHSCLMHRTKITEWLIKLFENFDPIAQLGMRHIFSYGRHLQNKNNPYLINNSRYLN